MTDVLGFDVSDRVATVTLDRPAARNALNRDLRRALHRTMQQVADDDGVDVVILTGSDPAFCAGLDLKELGASADASVDALASADGTARRMRNGTAPTASVRSPGA